MDTIYVLRSKADQVKEAFASLKNGEIIAFPTETVYGLGVICNNDEAYRRLVKIKRRPADKPFSLMVGTYTDIARYADLDARTMFMIQHLLPGSVTLLVKARKGIPHQIDLGTGVVGIRFPKDAELASLIEGVGEPLLVPSANRSSEPPCKDGKQLFATFFGQVGYVIDGGKLNKAPTTIIDLSKPGEIHLVREGDFPFEKAEKLFKEFETKTISLGSDHGGFEYKEAIKEHLLEKGFKVRDHGTDRKESCDYPVFAHLAAEDIVSGDADLGVLVCTSGEGVCMAANKHAGIRCGIGYDDIASGKTREHNAANMIAFGQKYMRLEDVLRRVDIFLLEKPSDLEKHKRRVGQLEK